MQIVCVKYFSENKQNQCTMTLKLSLADICKNIHMYPSMCGSIMVSLDCMVIRENALITKLDLNSTRDAMFVNKSGRNEQSL